MLFEDSLPTAATDQPRQVGGAVGWGGGHLTDGLTDRPVVCVSYLISLKGCVLVQCLHGGLFYAVWFWSLVST